MRANNVRAILFDKEMVLKTVSDTSMESRRIRRDLQCDIRLLKAIAEDIEHAWKPADGECKEGK